MGAWVVRQVVLRVFEGHLWRNLTEYGCFSVSHSEDSVNKLLDLLLHEERSESSLAHVINILLTLLAARMPHQIQQQQQQQLLQQQQHLQQQQQHQPLEQQQQQQSIEQQQQQQQSKEQHQG